MKAVILAAGKGTRMGELTKEMPKPLLSLRGKTLLEYKIDALPDEVDEVILLVGYFGEKIRAHFGDSYGGRKITYVTQSEALGTAHALWQAAHLLTEHFIVMMGDDLYAKKDIETCLKYDQAGLISELSGPMSGGKIVLRDDFIVDILEGKHAEGGLISTGLFVLSPVIFKYPMQKMPGREELGIPPTIMQAIHEMPIRAVYATHWKQISAPEDLQISEEEMSHFLT